jgi:hypothetical protein
MDAEPLELVDGLEHRRSERERRQRAELHIAATPVPLVDEKTDREEAAVVGDKQLLEDRRIDRHFVGERDRELGHDDRVKPAREQSERHKGGDPRVEDDFDH